jgi:hypothetical protein
MGAMRLEKLQQVGFSTILVDWFPEQPVGLGLGNVAGMQVEAVAGARITGADSGKLNPETVSHHPKKRVL